MLFKEIKAKLLGFYSNPAPKIIATMSQTQESSPKKNKKFLSFIYNIITTMSQTHLSSPKKNNINLDGLDDVWYVNMSYSRPQCQHLIDYIKFEYDLSPNRFEQSEILKLKRVLPRAWMDEEGNFVSSFDRDPCSEFFYFINEVIKLDPPLPVWWKEPALEAEKGECVTCEPESETCAPTGTFTPEGFEQHSSVVNSMQEEILMESEAVFTTVHAVEALEDYLVFCSHIIKYWNLPEINFDLWRYYLEHLYSWVRARKILLESPVEHNVTISENVFDLILVKNCTLLHEFMLGVNILGILVLVTWLYRRSSGFVLYNAYTETKLYNLKKNSLSYFSPAGLFFGFLLFLSVFFALPASFYEVIRFFDPNLLIRVNELIVSNTEISGFGGLLYSYYAAHLLITGMLLLVILLGVFRLTHSPKTFIKHQSVFKQLSRSQNTF